MELTNKIQVGVYEVSVAQFKNYVTGNIKSNLHNNKDFLSFNGNDETLPVVYVSWNDTQGFIRWLNAEKPSDDQGNYRLPTEAEWEHAARSGKGEIYFIGNSPAALAQYAWFEGNSYSRDNADDAGRHPVGRKQDNPWGLFDMYGNVYEWVSDWYSHEYNNKSTPNNPDGPTSGQFRVIRGGAWNFETQYCRSAARSSYPPGARSRSIGFRIVRELAQ